MNEKIENIIVKFLTNGANEEELEKLSNWLKIKDNAQFFDHYIKTNYALDMNMNEFDSKGVKKALMEKIKQDKRIFYKLKIHKVMKYAAVAVVFLGLGYFYQHGVFENDLEMTPPSENITLQLENGNIEIINEDGSSKIVDAQGNVVGSQNGTQLVYNNDNNLESLVYNTLTVPYGKRSKVHLSDGTVVNLNAGTSLKFPVKFIEGKDREVFVQGGEAYFDVTKDIKHPFIVNANEIGIRVLGTKFNISSYPEDEDISTVLVEGSVSIYNKKESYTPENATLLKPGFKADWGKSKNEITIEEADVEMYTAWIKGKIIFRHIPFKNIIKKLERHYNVVIINNNKKLDEKLITTSFDVETIEEVFKILKEINDIDYTINKNQIIIN
ncbi:FecR family protein [Flavivirga spongiicola]|uniref:FecR domain-containing protein n=1 Tax=Flavivirga spongiicola TaxID=421621 RepID=A0ABU7XNX6_9FLAO|nr:FecR domain-containing protein [Flavivirga sp. MEBiC05379]MDO5977468.1 FecR domain-containing protein [Flavivirga sp. MEBiC05379]